jgi:hypothetical protein
MFKMICCSYVVDLVLPYYVFLVALVFLFCSCIGFLVVCLLCIVCIAVCRFNFLEAFWICDWWCFCSFILVYCFFFFFWCCGSCSTLRCTMIWSCLLSYWFVVLWFGCVCYRIDSLYYGSVVSTIVLIRCTMVMLCLLSYWFVVLWFGCFCYRIDSIR